MKLFEKRTEGTKLKKNPTRKPPNFYILNYSPIRNVFQFFKKKPKSSARYRALPECWQNIISELESKEYRAFLSRLVGFSKFDLDYEWHLRFRGTDVSPHIDGGFRIASHLFYFNDEKSWNPSWGGCTLLLGKRDEKATHLVPQIEEFEEKFEIPFVGNQSLFYNNSPVAWHAVGELSCPEGIYRRMFMVMVLRPDSFYFWQSMRSYVRSLFLKMLPPRLKSVLKKGFHI